MKTEEFVEIIRSAVGDSAVQDTIATLEHPPGRRPAFDLVQNSNWYLGLDDEGKDRVQAIVRDSVESAIFGFFCVLDGVRAIEDTEDKGSFELQFVKNDIVYLLSPNKKAFLYELFNST